MKKIYKELRELFPKPWRIILSMAIEMNDDDITYDLAKKEYMVIIQANKAKSPTFIITSKTQKELELKLSEEIQMYNIQNK